MAAVCEIRVVYISSVCYERDVINIDIIESTFKNLHCAGNSLDDMVNHFINTVQILSNSDSFISVLCNFLDKIQSCKTCKSFAELAEFGNFLIILPHPCFQTYSDTVFLGIGRTVESCKILRFKILAKDILMRSVSQIRTVAFRKQLRKASDNGKHLFVIISLNLRL